MNANVQWADLVEVLKWIFGGVAVLTVTILGAAISVIWAGGRWTGRIEATLGSFRRDNRGAHRFIWHVLRLDHPELPEHLPSGDGDGDGDDDDA